jgi:transcriptional regulator with XRE-family HTH domain
MFHIYFKQVMDERLIKGAELANVLGCSHNNISKIRNGKTNPGIDRFWEILMAMEKLSPGSIRHFGELIAERPISFDGLIESMDNEQLSEILLKVSQALKQKRENNAKNEKQFLSAS